MRFFIKLELYKDEYDLWPQQKAECRLWLSHERPLDEFGGTIQRTALLLFQNIIDASGEAADKS